MSNWLNDEQAAASDIDQLAQQWQLQKQIELKAATKRREIEQQLTELVGHFDEGTATQETALFKVKTVGKMTRSVDSDFNFETWQSLPPQVQDCIVWKPSISTKHVRQLESMRDDLSPTLAKYMTTKPAKTAIQIEIKEG